MNTTEIARLVLRQRADVVKRLLVTPEGQELARLDDAYRALTGQEPPSWGRFAPGGEEQLERPQPEARKQPRATRGGSIRAQVQQILDHAPRQWNYDELIEELHRRNPRVEEQAKALRTSLRTALWSLVKDGDAERTAQGGVFWSSKFSNELRPSTTGAMFMEDLLANKEDA
jgi:hypothetical protein